MPSSHLILCRPLLLLPPIPPSIRVFSNESTLRIRYKEQGDRAEKLSPPSWKRFECALLQNVSLCFPKGIILSAIVSTDPQKSPFLLVLDARTFTELARASVDVEMHLDIHGLFIPDAGWDPGKQAPSWEAPARAAAGRAAPRT